MATDTILELQPTNSNTITFDVSGAEAKTGGYVVPLQSLRFNEDKRLEVTYSQGANVDGGEAITYHGPLTPITFQVVIYGTTKADMLQKSAALALAVMDEDGGMLKYKPAGVGDSVPFTFYRYVQSEPPKTLEMWDKDAQSSGLYRMQVDVELKGHPYAQMDPDSPTVVVNNVTVYNQDDGVTGYATITANAVKGTIGALTQLRIRNLVSGAWAAIHKLWYFRRSSGLTNFNPILEGGTADSDSSIWWSTISDTSRRSNNFLRYAPPEAANDQWAYRSFTINNPTDHTGRAAIAVVCRSWAEQVSAWELKASIVVAAVEMETSVITLERVGAWHVAILGELDIPPTPISADETYSPVLRLYLRRNTGDETQALDLDFAMLLYVDEYPQQVTVVDGFTDSYRLLLENFQQELCHVVNQSTLAFEKTAEPIASLLQLKPDVEQRIYFLWERSGKLILEDGFEDYEAWRYVKLSDMDDTADFDTAFRAYNDSTYYVEGSGSIKLSPVAMTVAYCQMSVEWDMTQEGRFTDDDYLVFPIYVENVGDSPSIKFTFYTDSSNYFYWGYVPSGTGWDFKKAKRSDFLTYGSPSWSNITQWEIYVTFAVSDQPVYYIDDMRLVKADPDDATTFNDTGAVWDFMQEVWHVEEQDSTNPALGCLDIAAGVEQVALIHEEPSANIKLLAKVRAKRDDGEVGLVFRCKDGTSGSEDMAAFFVDTTNDQFELRKWAAGSPSDIAAAITSKVAAPDTDYWLGVQVIGSTVRTYFGTTKAAIWDEENEEFVESARQFSVTDSDFASGGALDSGQAGVLSTGTLGRFDDVELYALGEHIPGDSVQIYLPIIMRTVYPFGE